MSVTKPIDDAIPKLYEEFFDGKWYRNSRYSQLYPGEKNALGKIHEAFTQGKMEGPIKSCINIGCGPTVHRMSAPSKVCDTLVFSDYSSNCLQIVQEWIDAPGNETDSHNVFKFCAKLEGFEDLDEGAKVIEKRIKSKVNSVKKINVLLSEPMGQLDELFDVVFSASCLESASDSYETYVNTIKNVATLIRPRGYLLLKGYMGATYYKAKGVKFPSLTLSIELVKKSLTEGGFEVLEIEVIDEECEEVGHNSDKTGSFFAMARKI